MKLLAQAGWLGRLRRAWKVSLRFRLIVLGLMPVLLAFPLVIGVLVVVGGQRADALLSAQINGELSGVRNFLEAAKSDTQTRIGEMVRSGRLDALSNGRGDAAALGEALATLARGSGLDYLLVAGADGTVLASSSGVLPGVKLPDSHVIRQARIGVASAAFERFEASELKAFSPRFRQQLGIAAGSDADLVAATETRGLFINAAVHFPLSIDAPDRILVGGIVLNKNSALIERMRDVIFPVGALPDQGEGMTAIFLDDVSVAASRQRLQGMRPLGLRAPTAVASMAANPSASWIGVQRFGGVDYMTGYAPLVDGDGRNIGLVSVGFPDAPYRRMIDDLLAAIGALLGLTLLGVSIVFLRAGDDLTQRLAQMAATMSAVRRGDRLARVGRTQRPDEIGILGKHFDRLLDTISRQDARHLAAQRVIADEASRWRALFENTSVGVVIIDADGSVFALNPKFAAMLGYDDVDAVKRLRLEDWDELFSLEELVRRLENSAEPLVETRHRRRDGSTYPALVSLSRAHWQGRLLALLTMRDISQQKIADAELERRTAALRQSEARARAFLDTALDAVVVLDEQARIVEFNPAAERMFGRASDEVRGQALALLVTLQADSATLAELGEGSHEGIGTDGDGRTFPIELTLGSMDDDEHSWHVAIIRDVTERKAAEQEMQRLANVDGLTQVLNRRAWSDGAKILLAQANRTLAPMSLLSIDADHFKQINDTWGHLGGDAVLRALAQTLSACLRESDLLGRLGGEEFAILLPDTDALGTKALIERLLQAVRACRVDYEGQTLSFTVSIGVTLLDPARDDELRSAFKRADDALYRAKREGRDRACWG
ncbi:diguanylate cyclase domain-containing protein [Rhodocyclus purpureus]|uniref:diguanylate cyclase domain-containing protein n=1 Tax=Rhodocyclus purpureus TaxID=1067 RepID=UPI001913D72C|nr:diguanylate cyclase [Rhodocyclus purpureus]MBK5914212.1 hypothetical protein [Rhodocyclus purpureus]